MPTFWAILFNGPVSTSRDTVTIVVAMLFERPQVYSLLVTVLDSEVTYSLHNFL